MSDRKANRKRTATRCGLSLLEAVVAIAIFSVAIVALGTLSSTGIQAASKANLELLSDTICQSVMDDLQVQRRLKNTPSPQPIVGCPGWLYTLETSPGSFHSLGLGNDSSGEVLAVTVRVWKEGKSANQSRSELKQLVSSPLLGSNSSFNSTVAQRDD